MPNVQRVPPKPGQESVWDYPRPPACVPSDRLVVVSFAGREVARTRGAWRVLETSHPPTWYLPPSDIDPDAIVSSNARATLCEWKGQAQYWDVLGPDTDDGQGRVAKDAGWSYPNPTPNFTAITDYIAFMPGLVDCDIDGERVRPQDGGFYGGWITDDVVGPFKGSPGTLGW